MIGKRKSRTEYHREWRKNNPEKVKAIRQKQQDSGYCHAYNKSYRATLICKYSQLKSKARVRKIQFDLEKDIFIKWLKNIKHCIYCNIEVTRGIKGNRKNWQTIDRMDNKLGYFIGNIVCSCYRCNILKSDDISFFTMREIGKILEKARNKK